MGSACEDLRFALEISGVAVVRLMSGPLRTQVSMLPVLEQAAHGGWPLCLHLTFEVLAYGSIHYMNHMIVIN